MNKKLDLVESKLENLKMSINDLPKHENKEYLKLYVTVSYIKEILDSNNKIVKTENKKEILSYVLKDYIFINLEK